MAYPMNNTKTRIASVAMHSAMGDPTTNLDRIAEWSSKAHEPLHGYISVTKQKKSIYTARFSSPYRSKDS